MKQAEVPSVRVSPPSPTDQRIPNDETDATDLIWVKHALDNPAHQDAGEGVHPGGLVDGIIEDQQRSTSRMSRSKEL